MILVVWRFRGPVYIAVRQLLFTLLATALIVPYFKRSSRVKATFVNP
ncbi:DUF2569 family protein [Escherichia coli]|nr:DUF2569 family protein [Escherichia coli]